MLNGLRLGIQSGEVKFAARTLVEVRLYVTPDSIETRLHYVPKLVPLL